MYVLPHSGLGSTTSTAISATAAGAEVGVAAASIAGVAAATAAIPFVGPVIAGLTLLFGSLFQPNTNKLATTSIVNQVEPGLKQLVASWKALPASEKTAATQQEYLQTFLSAWNDVVTSCCGSCPMMPADGEGVAAACCSASQQYKTAGINCVADRQRGGQYDWWSYYYDPIANDPTVQQNSSVTSLASGVTADAEDVASGLSWVAQNPTLALAGGAVLLLVMAL